MKTSENYALKTLTKEYQNWLEQEKLPNLSADEVLAQTDNNELDGELITTEAQRAWLTDFLKRWENVQAEKAITHEPQDKDAWVCICGNMPSENGFYSCDASGALADGAMDESANGWDGKHYLCNQCKRVIDGDTLQIVAQRKYQIEHGTYGGYTVRILEKHWSGAASWTLPRACDTEQEARDYAEGWFNLGAPFPNN